eukprot:6478595-Amphidinium_carterae.2
MQWKPYPTTITNLGMRRGVVMHRKGEKVTARTCWPWVPFPPMSLATQYHQGRALQIFRP